MTFFIEVQNLSKQFNVHRQKVDALKNISFRVEKGNVFGIIGLSGAGKSTLIRCLATLEKPTAGQILIEGQDITKMTKEELCKFRKKIGMIFQQFNLLSSRTVAENIAFPLEIAGTDKNQIKERVQELIHLVGLDHRKNAYPLQLSGGEKQRVGIARALANHPLVLFCDEATSALDPRTTKEILALLKQLNKTLGITIVLITHEMEVIKRICNKVSVIEKGEIVEHGEISKIFSEPQHSTTKSFLQNMSHEIPAHFLQSSSPKRKLLRLCFKGTVANEPIIDQMAKKFQIEANILLGWIDYVQKMSIGTLVIEIAGMPENITNSLLFLREKGVQCEVIEK